MAAIQATTATTLNLSPDRKQAAGRDTKWKRKLAEPTPTPLRRYAGMVGLGSSVIPEGQGKAPVPLNNCLGLVLDGHCFRIDCLLACQTFKPSQNATIVVLVALHRKAALRVANCDAVRQERLSRRFGWAKTPPYPCFSHCI